MNRLKLPLIALRPHQESATVNYFDPDPEDLIKPFTKIIDSDGQTVVTAHDSFSFREGHAELLTNCVNHYAALIGIVREYRADLQSDIDLDWNNELSDNEIKAREEIINKIDNVLKNFNQE